MKATVDLNAIPVFLGVVEAGSFTGAAQKLGLPKSVVSRRVSQLEEALGARLLHRTTRAVRLTDAGIAFRDRASSALAGLLEATETAAETGSEPRGTVRLTAPVDLGIFLLPEIVGRFSARHPGVHVEIELSNRFVDLVGEGFDLALRAGRLADSSLVAKKLGETESVLVASPAYLLRAGAPKKVADLAAHPCVLFRARGGRARWTLAGPSGDETVEVTGPLGAHDFVFARGAALAGVGVAFLPWPVCCRDLAAGTLLRVLPEQTMRGGTLHLVWPSSRHLPHRVALLRDFLAEELRSPAELAPPPTPAPARKAGKPRRPPSRR